MAKRSATTDLNHDNWDEEEKPEEVGVFQKASPDILKSRVIKTARRSLKTSDTSSGQTISPFSNFTGFGKATSTSSTSSPFSFLSQKAKTSDGNDQNGTGQEEKGTSSNKEPQFQFKPTGSSPLSSVGQEKTISSFSSGLAQNNLSSSTSSTTFKPFENLFKAKPVDSDTDKKTQNLELLKDLNLSCSKWISEHLAKNPYCILTPIFKDYEQHLAQLGLNTDVKKKDNEVESGKSVTTANSTTETASPALLMGSPAKPFTLSKDEPGKSSPVEKSNETTSEFKFGGMQSTKPFNIQFGNINTTFGLPSPSPFSLNQIAAKPVSTDEADAKKDDEESEEPPKNDFVPVVEEDSIYDIKCKVFVKKDGSFVSRGVGTLFLKPVKDSTKTQAVVRAHTNLGNILLNILLTPGMPIQKTGKNNAMIVCVPTPDSKPPPVPVLIRVKTSDECDALIKKLEECRGS